MLASYMMVVHYNRARETKYENIFLILMKFYFASRIKETFYSFFFSLFFDFDKINRHEDGIVVCALE